MKDNSTMDGWVIDKKNQYDLPDKKYTTCPLCSSTRKKNKETCAALDWVRGLGTCSHCGETFQLHTYKRVDANQQKVYDKPVWRNKTELNDKTVKFFESRSISQNTVKELGIIDGMEWMPQFKDKRAVSTIQFPYKRFNECINIKFRGPEKSFKLAKNAELIPFNLDSIYQLDECYIVEGEMDACAIHECGIKNVVSVPNGANLKTCNLEWLDNSYEWFQDKKKIILCVDDDEAGINLKNELVRRLGAGICHLVDLQGEKDANDYLIKKGKVLLKEALLNYTQVPITHVSTILDHKESFIDFMLNGAEKGFITGHESLDEHYSIELGQYTTVTGIPQSGKSEFIDQVVLSYARLYGWKSAYASPENNPNKFHSKKFFEKIYGRPMVHSDVDTPLLDTFFDFMHDYVKYIDYECYELEETLEKCAEMVLRYGIKVFVIDPYNKIKLKRGASMNVNDYTNEYHNVIDAFCRKYQVHLILIAHPIKQQKDSAGNYPVPDLYSVKGGGEHYDMTYHGLVVHRFDELGFVLVRTLKVKFKHLGEAGRDCWFKYDKVSGRYCSVEGDPTEDTDACKFTFDKTNWLDNSKLDRYDYEEPKGNRIEISEEIKDSVMSKFKGVNEKNYMETLAESDFEASETDAPF